MAPILFSQTALPKFFIYSDFVIVGYDEARLCLLLIPGYFMKCQLIFQL